MSVVPPSRAPPTGSVASVHSHLSAISHLSGSRKAPTIVSPPAKSEASYRAPTVVPSDSISQIGSHVAREYEAPPPPASNISPKHSSPGSHYSGASHSQSQAGSQRLTEANLHAHDVEPRSISRSHVSAVHEVEVEMEEEYGSRASHHSGADSRSHHTSYRAATVESGSLASGAGRSRAHSASPSSRSPTVTPSRIGSAVAGSRAPSAVPSHLGSASQAYRMSAREEAASAYAPSHAPSRTRSHATSHAPTSAPSHHSASVAPSRAPTSSPSQAASRALTSASSHHSAASSPSSHGSPTTPPQVAYETMEIVSASASRPSAAKTLVSRNALIRRTSSDTNLPRLGELRLVEVVRRPDEFIDTEYRIQRKHVFPVRA